MPHLLSTRNSYWQSGNRTKTVRRAARRDPSYRLVPSPRMQYVKRYGRFSSDQFLTRTAFFLVCHPMCMNPGGVLFHVTDSCERYQAPELARSTLGKSDTQLFESSPPVGTVSRVCSSRRYALHALTRSLCTDSLLPYITMSLQRFLAVFDYPPCIASHKGFCSVSVAYLVYNGYNCGCVHPYPT